MGTKLQLIPHPAKAGRLPGRLHLGSSLAVYAPVPKTRHLTWVLQRVCEALRLIECEPLLSCTDRLANHRGEAPTLSLEIQSKANIGPEGFFLRILQTGACITARTETGLAYGGECLLQLLRQFGDLLPCLDIQDKPALNRRGFYLDISRGKVPKLTSLFRLADRLAILRYNHLQLYMEHTFAFAFDPEIGRGSGALTADEVLELRDHCRARGIELVPSFACFGHMGRILSLPQYAPMAEKPFPAKTWEQATWRQRLRGCTVNPYHPGARKLFANIFRELLPLFDGNEVNICGDETYDLGKGVNAGQASGKGGIGRLYVDHLLQLRKLADVHRKHLMCWSDVLLQHPEIIRRLPKDITVLDWGYEPTTPFRKIRKFTRAGITAWAVPATRSFRVIFNQVEVARANIAGYAAEAQRAGAEGLLLTDWGDMGHFNVPAASLHALFLGSAMAWNPCGPSGEKDFDPAFALHCFHDRSGDMALLFRVAGTTPASSWPFFLQAPGTSEQPPSSADGLRTSFEAATLSVLLTNRTCPSSAMADGNDYTELGLMLRALLINGRKVHLEHSLKSGKPSTRELRTHREKLKNFWQDYARHWQSANKKEGLEDLARAFIKPV